MIKNLLLFALIIACTALSACNTDNKQQQTPTPTPMVEISVPELENPPVATIVPSPTPSPTPSPEQNNQPQQSPTSTLTPTPAYERFKENKQPEPQYILDARAKNSEVIGWIKIPHTRIDYPVVQADSNEKYLNLSAEGKKLKAGAIFMDYRNKDKNSRRHTIIYGHNMRSGSMFHDLNSFKVKDFFESNKYFTLWLDGQEQQYEVIGHYVVSADINFIKTKFNNDKEFIEYINQLLQLNKFPSDIEIKADDQILTLCTCTYEYDNSRCVVISRRVK